MARERIWRNGRNETLKWEKCEGPRRLLNDMSCKLLFLVIFLVSDVKSVFIRCADGWTIRVGLIPLIINILARLATEFKRMVFLKTSPVYSRLLWKFAFVCETFLKPEAHSCGGWAGEANLRDFAEQSSFVRNDHPLTIRYWSLEAQSRSNSQAQ